MSARDIWRLLQDRDVTVIAEKTGIHPNTIRRIKNGNGDATMNTRTLEKLARYFNADTLKQLL